MREGCQNAVLDMPTARAEPAWRRIGQSLRDYYEAPPEFPPELLTLVRKLDAIEGNYLSRHAVLAKPRSAGPSENSPLLVVVIVIALIVGTTLTIMNKACKADYHAWCAPMSTLGHHIKTRPPA